MSVDGLECPPSRPLRLGWLAGWRTGSEDVWSRDEQQQQQQQHHGTGTKQRQGRLALGADGRQDDVSTNSGEIEEQWLRRMLARNPACSWPGGDAAGPVLLKPCPSIQSWVAGHVRAKQRSRLDSNSIGD